MVVERDRTAEDGVTKLLDMEFSSKIQILDAPIQLPGVCGLCGTSRTDDRQYIDIGLWFEMYGQFYFCTFCMTQMVNRLGGLTPEQAENLEKELNQARQTILDFQEEKAAIDGVVNTLRSTGLFSNTDLSGITGAKSVDAEQESPELTSKSSGNKQDITGSVIVATETPGKQRSNDVSSARSNELDNWL